MVKVMYGLLILNLMGWVWDSFNKLGRQPLLLLVNLLINGGIFWLLWKGTTFYSRNKKVTVKTRLHNLGKGLILFFYSITATEIGMVVSFLLRIVIDRGLASESSWALALYRLAGSRYTFFTYILGVLLAYPIFYLFAKALHYSKPRGAALVIALIWIGLMVALGSLVPNLL